MESSEIRNDAIDYAAGVISWYVASRKKTSLRSTTTFAENGKSVKVEIAADGNETESVNYAVAIDGSEITEAEYALILEKVRTSVAFADV